MGTYLEKVIAGRSTVERASAWRVAVHLPHVPVVAHESDEVVRVFPVRLANLGVAGSHDSHVRRLDQR